MKRESFVNPNTGRLVPVSGGALAFVPSPLPPRFEMSWQLTRRLSEADRAVGTLVGIARILPNPHILTQPFVRREAVLSSRIEGTQASLTDVMTYEAGAPSRIGDVLEVLNYVAALQHGRERLPELPLSLRFIRELHTELMKGVRGGTKQPGEFRKIQNWIGEPGCDLASATYVPPPVPEMHAALDALEKFLHEPSPLPSLVRAAMIHYQFEAIHPFLDGNGRIGRLLLFFVLHLENVLEEPWLYVSAFFERHRQEYYTRLLEVSTHGAWDAWIDFFLRGVAEQAGDAARRTQQLVDLAADYRRRVARARNAGALSRFIDQMLESPVVTPAIIAEALHVSYPAARKTLNRLLSEDMLEPMQFGKRTFYLARGFLDILA